MPDTGSLPASSLDTAKYKSPVTGNNVPADEICEVNKPAYLVICPSADNISMTNEEQIKSVYTTLINAIKAKSPDTKIICCSLTPIASNYQYEDITNELIQKVNGWIAAAAESNSVKYLDMASGLVGDDGFLPQTYQDGDGMHLNAEGMKAWMTYLRTLRPVIQAQFKKLPEPQLREFFCCLQRMIALMNGSAGGASGVMV